MGYQFKDQQLLRAALYHSSYANEHRTMGISSNERLEFLGDAVLGFVSADFLYRKHPDLPEGELTRLRRALLCEESLHEVAQSLRLGDFLLLGKGGQQMLLLHRVVGIFHRDALCSLQSLTGFLCHLFDVHSAYLL